MNLSLIIIVTFFIATLFANYRLRIFSVKPTMLGAIFLLTLFIQIVPGTVLVSYFDYPMAFGVDNAITEEIKTNTFIYTLASITLLLLLVSLFSCFFHFDIDFEKLETNHTRAKLLTFFSFIVIVVKMASVGNIPFLMAIRGDSVGAALAKAQILKNEVGFGGLFIGYIFVYFPYVSLIYSYCHKKRHAYGTLLFRINLFLIIIYSVYDMQKSKFVVVLFILFVLYLRLSKKINYSIVIATPIISLLVLSTFFILLHNTPVSDVFDSVLARLFIGQTEGAFMIYQFPTAGDAWVNSNSYFQAHAWSIFGDISLIIGPLVVALNILGLCIIKELFSKIDSAYASCVYIVIILTLPIVNDFSYFLFFKSWFCIMVLMTFYVFTIKVIEIYGQAIKNKTQR